MADYFCVFMMLFPLFVNRMPCNRLRCRLQAYVLSLLLPMRIYDGYISFCPLFSDVFNTKSAIFIHQSLTLPQKIDSREGLF
ncbi:MAG: hypothetical protein D8H98_18180 [Prevotella sp.]|nr:MAG: hypothetical protein D8H98_18180 [Prevotella sp.]